MIQFSGVGGGSALGPLRPPQLTFPRSFATLGYHFAGLDAGWVGVFKSLSLEDRCGLA